MKAYERARITRANEIIRLSTQMGKMYQSVYNTSSGMFLTVLHCRFVYSPEYEDLPALQSYLEGGWDNWMYAGNPTEEAEAAIAWMVESSE